MCNNSTICSEVIQIQRQRQGFPHDGSRGLREPQLQRRESLRAAAVLARSYRKVPMSHHFRQKSARMTHHMSC
jgi:hypothetical protein